VSGLAKTVVGFLAGIVGTTFIVAQTIPRFLVFFIATALQLAITFGLHFLLDPQAPSLGYYGLLAQSLGNALLGVLLFQVGDALPGMLDRRRAMSRGRARR
jgi:hypothetical protein